MNNENLKKFYVVATPIGNLEDISLRALRILKEVDLILCEDTRVTKRLLNKYEIKTPVQSYSFDKVRVGRAQPFNPKVEKIISFLKEGKNIALVSDAGTPTISDPGSFLISKIKESFGDSPNGGVQIIPVPGANALIAAFSASGVPSSEFLFLGFLPHKKGRETLFKEITNSKRAVAFYESPHRLLKTLEALKDKIGERKIVVARELTKIYEDIRTGSAGQMIKYFEENKDKLKGEFVIIVSRA